MHFDSPTPPIISNSKSGSSDRLAQPLDASNGVPGSPKVGDDSFSFPEKGNISSFNGLLICLLIDLYFFYETGMCCFFPMWMSRLFRSRSSLVPVPTYTVTWSYNLYS